MILGTVKSIFFGISSGSGLFGIVRVRDCSGLVFGFQKSLFFFTFYSLISLIKCYILINYFNFPKKIGFFI